MKLSPPGERPLVIRVLGTARAGAWSPIDYNSATAFVASKYLER